VESERVPEEVSGHLSKSGHSGMVISASQQSQLERRSQKAASAVDALFAAKKAAGEREQDTVLEGEHTALGAGSSSPEAAATGALVPATITLPAGKPTSAWWQQLASGSLDRLISKDAAVVVVRAALGHTIGENRGGSVPINFGDGPITVGDVLGAVDAVAGVNGQRTLRKLADF
jgi:hypothetical protein